MNSVYVISTYCPDAGFHTIDEDAGAWTTKAAAEEYIVKTYGFVPGNNTGRYYPMIVEIKLNKISN